MVSLELQEQVIVFNSQFNDNYELIKGLHAKLSQGILELNLSLSEINDAKEYIEDEDNGEYHPLIFVRLRYFPRKFRNKNKSLKEHIQSYASLVMEMARKLTWNMTCEKRKKEDPYPLVSQMTVIVNLSNAPIIPVDAELIRMMSMILDDRFPGCISSINVLNFGWMYQGIWSIVKYLLNEEAKSFIRFTSIRELQPVISEFRILREMGGCDDYIWSAESDSVLQKYGTFHKDIKPALEIELPNTPPLSSVAGSFSRSTSITTQSSGSSTDVFYDALEASSFTSPRSLSSPTSNHTANMPLSQSLPTTHELAASSSLGQYTAPLPGATTLYPTIKPYFGQLSFWADIRKGINCLASYIDTQRITSSPATSVIQRNEKDNDSSIIIVEPPLIDPTSSDNAIKVISEQNQIKPIFIRLTRRFIQFAFGPKRGVAYWVLVYLFLRGPVELIIKKTLMRVSWVQPKNIATTAVGITAAVAAVTSSSLSNTLERLRKED
ncbi:MAG: hypothetical protein EXX96DRAFT_486062 [Benjaminiella poitrasii]|nr:MAG: hypothetical protein EXX96DRAFT_486062 [Benjaminiella poitrasii]